MEESMIILPFGKDPKRIDALEEIQIMDATTSDHRITTRFTDTTTTLRSDSNQDIVAKVLFPFKLLFNKINIKSNIGMKMNKTLTKLIWLIRVISP